MGCRAVCLPPCRLPGRRRVLVLQLVKQGSHPMQRCLVSLMPCQRLLLPLGDWIAGCWWWWVTAQVQLMLLFLTSMQMPVLTLSRGWMRRSLAATECTAASKLRRRTTVPC